MKKVVSLLLLCASPSLAQVTGFVEDFNDNVLTGWEMPHPNTFFLTEADGVLKITYTRTASSWEWDNFNFTPSQVVDIATKPYINLRAKSNIGTELTLKPIYNDNRNDWLQVILPADTAWHSYTFRVTTTGSTLMNRIYMYLDGGTKSPKSGTVYFDDLRIGTAADSIPSYAREELETAVAAANALYQNAEEGSGEGQFPVGAKVPLKAAIEQASALLLLPSPSQEELEAATWDLYDACVTLESSANVLNPGLNDAKATPKTKYLYYNLDRLAADNLIFGMHDATGYGVGWSGDDDRSDVKDVCGDYPAFYSWDMNHVDRDDPNDRLRFTYRIRAAHRRGGINSLVWHQYDPQNRSFYAADINYEKVVPTLLPGGTNHSFYRNRLRNIAKFLKGLRGDDGYSIPIIFRPYHEHDGNWFWWGVGNCTTQEYNELWQFTVSYLRDSLHVHNLIYAISPSQVVDKASYLSIYPGDAFVDIFGMDYYFGKTVNDNDKAIFLSKLRVPARLGLERDKVAALTEVGQETLPTANWFTGYLLPPLKTDSIASTISYAAVWRNAHSGHFYAPYPGHSSVPDFLKFYQDPYTLFEKDLPNMFGPAQEDHEAPQFLSFPPEHSVVFDTTFTVQVVTNERAFLRYGPEDRPYGDMPFEFTIGQSTREHSTTLYGTQGMTYTYYVKAIDLSGNVSQALRFSFTVDTLQKPIPWNDVRYQTRDWKQGQAPLGYGGNDYVTATAPARTVYFRKIFSLAERPSAMGFLVKCHDGAVVYVNGMEIRRVNMPTGVPINYDTNALNANQNNPIIVFNQTVLQALRVGDNVLAVEVHTAGGSPVDLSFDGRLFNQSKMFIDLGATWDYYDAGQEPAAQLLREILDVHQSPTERLIRFDLLQNYPNPFNPLTYIRYSLPRAQTAKLQVFDVTGRLVTTLRVGRQPAGEHAVLFDGSHLASGIYFYRLETDSFSAVRRMLLIK